MNKEVVIIGAGGHGRVIADIVRKSGDIMLGFLDDNVKPEGDVIGKVDDWEKYREKWFVIAIGDNGIRKKIADAHQNLRYYTAIHPKAVIGEGCKIGEGTCVMANAVINPYATVGKHCIINTNSTVEHDNILGDFVHISPGAVLCGTVEVGDNTHIGAATVIKNNIKITSDCKTGIGAVVVKDIIEAGTYIGVPAQKIKK